MPERGLSEQGGGAMSKILTTEQRLTQIHDEVLTLGYLDGWSERIIAMGLWAGGNNALHDFVMDAPFAILFLLALVADQEQEIRRLKTMRIAEASRE